MDPTIDANFFDVLFARLGEGFIQPLILNIWTNLQLDFQDEVRILATLALAFAALAVAFGRVGWGYYLTRVLVIMIILLFLHRWEYVVHYVYEPFIYGPVKVVESIMRTQSITTDNYAALNDMMVQITDVCFKIWERVGWNRDAMLWFFVGLGYYLTGITLLVFVAFVLAMAQIGIAVLLMIFPIVLWFLMFERTAGVFGRWLQMMVGFSLVPIFYTIGMVLTMTLLGDDIKLLAEEGDSLRFVQIAANGSLLFICFAFNLLLGKMILSISGGIHVDGAAIYRRIQQSTTHVIRDTKTVVVQRWHRKRY